MRRCTISFRPEDFHKPERRLTVPWDLVSDSFILRLQFRYHQFMRAAGVHQRTLNTGSNDHDSRWPTRTFGRSTIEFFGYCGSGKSSIAAQLHERLAACGLSSWRPNRPNGAGFVEIARRYPLLAARLGLDPRIVSQMLSSRTGRILVLAHLRQYDTEARSGGWTLLDEGFINRAWIVQTRAETVPPAIVDRLLPAAAVAIHVSVAPDVAQERIRNRQRDLTTAPMNKLLAESPVDEWFWQRAIETMTGLRRAVERSGTAIVDVDNTIGVDVDALAERVIEVVGGAGRSTEPSPRLTEG